MVGGRLERVWSLMEALWRGLVKCWRGTADIKARPRDHLQSAVRVLITLYLFFSLYCITIEFVLHC